MVNNLGGSGITAHVQNDSFPDIAEANKARRIEQGEMAKDLGLSEDKMNQDPGIANLKTSQEQRDAQKIKDLRTYIANGGQSLGEMAKMASPASVVPDSIDEIGPRFEYSPKNAQRYLNELNVKYPIKQVLGDHYEDIVSGKRRLFNMSVVGKALFEDMFTACIVASAQSGKWISSPFHYGFLTLKELAEEAAITESNNPFHIIQKHELLGLYEDNLKQSVAAKIFRQPKQSQVYAFPKEHLIQDLMRRLKTNLQENAVLTQK